jgi:hypothetical protein
MANGADYFSHDYNPRTDTKIRALIRKHGMRGYGLYWAIIEDLYSNGNSLEMDCDALAWDYREDCETVMSVVRDFDLFVINGDTFCSKSASRRLEEREKRSAKNRANVKRRWENQKVKPIEAKPKGAKPKEIAPVPDEWKAVWETWTGYKKTQHSETYKSVNSEMTALNKLRSMSGDNIATAEAIVEQSITNLWKGLFELKTRINDTNVAGNRKSNYEAYQERFREIDAFYFNPGTTRDNSNVENALPERISRP